MKLSSVRAPLAIIVVLAIAPVLIGCSLNPVESIIEQATGGDVNLDGASLPKDFPGDIPLVDSEIQSGAGFKTGNDQVWNVTIKSTDPAIFDAVAAQLTDAGFTQNEIGGGTTETGSLGTFTNDRYTVAVVVATEGGVTVNYTVTTTALAP
ncbi:hypothetical protein GCM10007382_06780 [Salinibacterium xinjiangense]|uniref:hypothetical protein n=1 Tax=Salinibacterium xinjiangense TaxID=386302 RepID=UPI00117AAEF2|nr:hypothetical protein [Salinibacterium xinjiangense]GGK89418.1 hypothetical protein GCM10007382_06780 [Salinibacterium xinjiangense]